jgi:hypothetical protein
MNILDHISESLQTLFSVKILKFFDEDADPSLGSGNLFDSGSGIRDGKIRIRNKQIKHPASATLIYGRYRCRVGTMPSNHKGRHRFGKCKIIRMYM